MTVGPHRWGALAFMLGSVLFLANKADEMSLHFRGRRIPDWISGDSTWVVVVGALVFAYGFAAYYRFYAPRASRAGRAALGMVAGGGVVLMLGHATFLRALARLVGGGAAATQVELMFLLVVIGGLLLFAGLAAFGLASLREPILARWRWLPLATGVMALAAFLVVGGDPITPAFLALRGLFALGLFGLGLGMWLEPAPAADGVSAAPAPMRP